MLANATVHKLACLGLLAMADGLAEQLATPGPWVELSFEDRLGLLVDQEATARESRRLTTRLRAAKLRYPASIEDLDLRTPRGLERKLVAELAQGNCAFRRFRTPVPVDSGHPFRAKPDRGG